MSVIQQARKHVAEIRKGIPSNQEAAFRNYATKLQQQYSVANHLDKILFSMNEYSFAETMIADLHVKIVRYSGLGYQILVEETIFNTISRASNEIADYLVG